MLNLSSQEWTYDVSDVALVAIGATVVIICFWILFMTRGARTATTVLKDATGTSYNQSSVATTSSVAVVALSFLGAVAALVMHRRPTWVPPALLRLLGPVKDYLPSILISSFILCLLLLMVLLLAVPGQSSRGIEWNQELQRMRDDLGSHAVDFGSDADSDLSFGGGGPEDAQCPHDFTGVWVKDPAKSSSMDEAMSLMRLNGIVRTAVRLVRGMDIRQENGQFKFSVFSVIPWFKVHEQYPLDGSPQKHKRRDLRKGQHVGQVEVDPRGIKVLVNWSPPVGGHGFDFFEFSPNGDSELHVYSQINVGSQTADYVTVYRRKR